MAFMIYTNRIGGNGTSYNNSYRCKTYSRDRGILEFWNEDTTKHYYISMHKMDQIMIETIDPNNVEKEVEIKCTT